MQRNDTIYKYKDLRGLWKVLVIEWIIHRIPISFSIYFTNARVIWTFLYIHVYMCITLVR